MNPNLTEAIAVYLYLQHQNRNSREERAFSAAWGAICQEAEKIASRTPPKHGDIE